MVFKLLENLKNFMKIYKAFWKIQQKLFNRALKASLELFLKKLRILLKNHSNYIL